MRQPFDRVEIESRPEPHRSLHRLLAVESAHSAARERRIRLKAVK
jgi:hypothetical protein